MTTRELALNLAKDCVRVGDDAEFLIDKRQEHEKQEMYLTALRAKNLAIAIFELVHLHDDKGVRIFSKDIERAERELSSYKNKTYLLVEGEHDL